MKRICIISGTLFVMAFFQNCQQATNFGSAADGSAKATGVLTPVDMNDQEDDQDEIDDDSSGQISQPGTPSVPPIPGHSAGSSGSHNDNNGRDNENEEDEEEEENDQEQEDEDDDGRLYVCILKGAGKSIKLGMVNAALAGQNQIPNVLCMTKKACLEIAGAKFEVLGAFRRGYCKDPGGNPHVQNISDKDLKDRCDKQ